MSYEITGLLHKKFETENKTATFQAREFVIEKEDRGYKNYIKFQLTQDRCSIIDDLEEGQSITVHFDLRGREWQDKYFTNLNAWKIDVAQPASADGGSEPDFPSEATGDSDVELKAEDFDDLPF
jgi:hypothetical protein